MSMWREVSVPKVHAPSAPETVLALLENWLVQTASNGTRFEDGMEFQLGWIWFRVTIDAKGARVTAPRSGAAALLHVDDCSDALRLVGTQQAVVSRYGLDPSPCSCRQSALVVRDLDSCRETFIDRLACEMDDHSGWYIGAHDSQLDVRRPENLKLVSLWQVLGRRPEIGPYLMLPPGWQVSFANNPVVMRDREIVTPGATSAGLLGATG